MTNGAERAVADGPKSEIRIVADEAALHDAAAHAVAAALVGAAADGARPSVALSGGTTPRGVYAALAAGARDRMPVPWERVEVFWSDERHVPPTHPDSNYRMARESLLSRVPIADAHVHRIRGEDPDPIATAARYGAEVRSVIGTTDGVPRFDLVLLGLGADGHTASLFPGSSALAPDAPLVAAPWVEALQARRFTMTLPLLNAARVVMFLVAGAAKSQAVRDVLQPGPSTSWLPARSVRPAGRLLWLVDRAAAAQLAPPLP
jgi:6-phosphogluconolactonase